MAFNCPFGRFDTIYKFAYDLHWVTGFHHVVQALVKLPNCAFAKIVSNLSVLFLAGKHISCDRGLSFVWILLCKILQASVQVNNIPESDVNTYLYQFLQGSAGLISLTFYLPRPITRSLQYLAEIYTRLLKISLSGFAPDQFYV